MRLFWLQLLAILLLLASFLCARFYIRYACTTIFLVNLSLMNNKWVSSSSGPFVTLKDFSFSFSFYFCSLQTHIRALIHTLFSSVFFDYSFSFRLRFLYFFLFSFDFLFTEFFSEHRCRHFVASNNVDVHANKAIYQNQQQIKWLKKQQDARRRRRKEKLDDVDFERK